MTINNIDPIEIQKFSELAHHWWDEGGEFKSLHQINPLRLAWINEIAPVAGKRLLDVGCGGGLLTESLAKIGPELVLGIDVASKSLEVAREHATLSKVTNVTYQEIQIELLAKQSPQSFDSVTCMEMLEHVPEPSAIINACAKLVKPGGYVFFSTINRNLKSFLQAIVAAEYILHLAPKGAHSYAKFIRPSELIHWCEQTDLEVCKMSGMSYHPLKKEFFLCQDASVNYMIAFQLPAD